MHLLETRPRQPLTGATLAAALGIALADRWPAAAGPWLTGLAVGALLLWWRPRTVGCWALTGAAFAVLHSLQLYHSPGRELARVMGPAPRVVQASGIVSTEPEKPATWSRRVSCFFRMDLETLEIPEAAPCQGVSVNVTWAGPPPAYGDRVTLTGTMQSVPSTRNPGQFDFSEYLHRQGIYAEIAVRYPADGRVLEHGQGSRLQAFAYAAQHWITDQLEQDLKDAPEISALIESMVLGLRGDTPQDAKVMFQRTGTMHLFAVSGLNVAMLAAIVLQLLRALRVTGGPALVVTLPILAFYAVVTGLSASCLRATIMGAFILLGPVFDRRAVVYNSIFASALFIFACDTNQLFLPGFQFSYVLVLVIVTWARPVQLWLEPFGSPDPFLPRSLWSWPQRCSARGWHLVSETMGVSLSSWAGSLLFTAGYFHLFSPSSILANFLAVPISFFILALGVATLVAAAWLPGAAVLFNNANWFAAKLLLAVVRFFAEAPAGHYYVETPHLARPPALEITALDLGDGGGIHLRAGRADWMIDCGSAALYDRVVLPYLRTRGVNQLDGLLLTHGDAHHLGGALSALDDFHPRCVADSILRDRSATRMQIHRALAQRQWGKALCQVGDVLPLGDGATMRVLFPPAGWLRGPADDKALVLQVSAAGRRVLLMSDSGFATEQWLLQHEPDLRSDLLIKGHHARDFSGLHEFLARVQPNVVICSQLDFGHPVEPLDEWERQTKAMGIEVFRQDRTGAVHVAIDHDGAWEARAFCGGQTFRSRAR